MRRIGRSLLLVALAALLLGFAGALGLAGSAAADEPLPPPAFPSGLSSPEDVGNDVGSDVQTEPGPTYEVTPGSPGSTLPSPESAQVSDARAALDRLNGTKTEKSKSEVAGPLAPSRAEDDGGADWYLIGAGVLVVLVFSEIGRINVTRARHRRPADEA